MKYEYTFCRLVCGSLRDVVRLGSTCTSWLTDAPWIDDGNKSADVLLKKQVWVDKVSSVIYLSTTTWRMLFK